MGIRDKGYLGNVKLKPANSKHHWTQDQLLEYAKCMDDPVHFIKNYIKIINVDKGLIKFEMWDFQEEMVQHIHDHRFSIFCCPRQIGKSTVTAAFILWYILFNDSVNVALLAHKLSAAKEILHRVKLAYENLPKWLQQGVIEWNKQSIELENGSRVLASATSGSAVRGGSFNLVFLDEFAFVPPNVADEFMASTYPTISSGKNTKVVVVSTPNGLNLFYKMWVEATDKRNTFKPYKVHWSQVPGRDDKWYKETIANIGEDRFRVEFDNEFIGSVATLITPTKLRSLAHRNPIYKTDEGFTAYEEPAGNHRYVIVVDCSRGVELDYHAFSVIDISTMPYRQVAKFRNNTMAPMVYPTMIYNIAHRYNDAYVLVELNEIGGQVADLLYNDYEYDNLLQVSFRGRGGQVLDGGFGSARSQFGVKTSKAVKAMGCSVLKTLIEEDKLIVNDFDTIQELSTFVAKKGSFEADDGCHDDLAMTLVLFGWMTQQPVFGELTKSNIKDALYSKKMQQIEDELTPFGFFNDGRTDPDKYEVDASGQVWEKVDDGGWTGMFF